MLSHSFKQSGSGNLHTGKIAHNSVFVSFFHKIELLLHVFFFYKACSYSSNIHIAKVSSSKKLDKLRIKFYNTTPRRLQKYTDCTEYIINEPVHEKTYNLDFRLGQTQTSL